MAVELKFIDENNEEIDLNAGFDLGMSRKGVANIKKVKIKNEGDITAKDAIIASGTLNSEEEVGVDEYNKQLIASKWKTFGLTQNGTYVKELSLGDIRPNAYVEGEKDIEVLYANQNICPWKDVWSACTTEFKLDRLVVRKLDSGSNGQVAVRMNIPIQPKCRDFDVEFNVEFDSTTVEQEDSLPFIGFPVRIDANGDGRGYMFLMHYRRSDSRFIVSIYKGAKGMTTNMDRDYGSKLFDTILYQNFDKNKKLRFKVYNNALGQPTFEVHYNGQPLKLGHATLASVTGYALSDSWQGSYTSEGSFYNDISLYSGDFFCAISSMKLTVEEKEQFVYIKTQLNDEAENKMAYKSSAIVSYIED